jgi:hypothetical protein
MSYQINKNKLNKLKTVFKKKLIHLLMICIISILLPIITNSLTHLKLLSLLQNKLRYMDIWQELEKSLEYLNYAFLIKMLLIWKNFTMFQLLLKSG